MEAATQRKSEDYTFIGPFTFPITLNFPFEAISVSITNNSDRGLFLSDKTSPVTINNARIIVPPRQIYHINSWRSALMYLGAASPFLANEYLIIQIWDTPASIPSTQLMPLITTLGDGVPNPTAPAVAAFPLTWDGVGWNRLQSAYSDDFAGTGFVGVQPLLFDNINSPAPGEWDRLREADWGFGGGLSKGVIPAVPHAWNASDGKFYPVYGSANGDGLTGTRLPGSTPTHFNGGTFDRSRNNESPTFALTLAARTAQVQSADFTFYNARGCLVWITVNAKAAATTLNVSLYGADGNGNYGALGASGALPALAGGVYACMFYPGLPGALQVANCTVARVCRIIVTPSDANSVTYYATIESLV